MKNPEIELMARLLGELRRAFAACKKDRQRIHQEEWEAGEGAPSFLGEAELATDAVSALGLRFLSGEDFSRPSTSIGNLQEYALDSHPLLGPFVSGRQSDFPDFVSYLKLIEQTRMLLMTILEASADASRGSSRGVKVSPQ